jgi:rubrerythrin
MSSKLELFLAHALALENEAGERYDELAGMMEVHNNPEVTRLFKQMAEFSHLHAASVGKRAEGHALPELKSWEYKWDAATPPEVGDTADTHYLMTPHHAIKFALDNEIRGWEFYRRTAQTADDPEIRKLAKEFADEEAEHVDTLKRWLAKVAPAGAGWSEDPDPANMVD